MSENPEATEQVTTTDDSRKSALEDNLEKKGKNAYYFAHAHKATGPKWDGKEEPKLLGRQSSSALVEGKKHAFEYHKSNINKYAFLDDDKTVKLYLDMEGVGEKCTEDDDITLDFTETSLCLIVRNYKEEEQCLSFGKLTAPITNATVRKKSDRLIISLTKQNEGKVWHTINDKGTPDHEVV